VRIQWPGESPLPHHPPPARNPIFTAGLKGSMRVRGPPPSQGVHIAKAVEEGMLAMFKGANASPASKGSRPPASEGSEAGSSGVVERESPVLPQPTLEEHVKVSTLYEL